MLYSLDTFKIITTVPHEKEFKTWVSRLSTSEIQAIKDELNSRIDNNEVHTSSWMPGRNWGGTVFNPIWETACKKNFESAAKCFGLILWQVMMERPDYWSFGRYKLRDVPIEGMTYFKIDKPT